MSAKKAAVEPDPTERKVEIRAEALLNAAEKMRKQAAELVSFAKAIEKLNPPTLKVDGSKKLERARTLVSDFLSNVKREVGRV